MQNLESFPDDCIVCRSASDEGDSRSSAASAARAAPSAVSIDSRRPGLILPWLAKLSPWMLIAGLAYAAVFVEPSSNGAPLLQPVVEPRDMFFGAAGDATSLWVVGQDGAVLHGVDGTWRREVLPGRGNLQAVAVSPDGEVVTVGSQGDLWLRMPGQAWRHAPLPVAEEGGKLLDVAFLHGHFWVVGEMGALFRAAPGATTWERMGEAQDVAFNAIRPGVGNDLWIAAEFGRLLRSRDGGQTWSTQELGSESLRAVAFDGQTGVAVGNTGHLYLSDNGGDDWRALAAFTSDHLHDVVVRNGLWQVVGDNGSYFQSDDPGGTWTNAALGIAELSKGYLTRILPLAGGNLLVGRQLVLLSAGQPQLIGEGARP